MMMMMMMMMMMRRIINCFCGMFDRQYVLSPVIYASFLAGTIVIVSHHYKSPTRREPV